jgi:hypothetical protein
MLNMRRRIIFVTYYQHYPMIQMFNHISNGHFTIPSITAPIFMLPKPGISLQEAQIPLLGYSILE